jgi:hypothetical protein
MNSNLGLHEHSRLIRSLRLIAILGLLATAVARVAQFHYHAIYPVPLLPLVGRDIFVSLPFLFVAIAACFVRRTLLMSVALLLLAVVVIVSGASLDFSHFAHLSKDSAFDGFDYMRHTFWSFVGVIAFFIFQLLDSNATVAESGPRE